MKLILTFLVSCLIATHGAPIRSASQISVDELFEMAWEYQNKLNPKQTDIDDEKAEFRNSLSTVLKRTSKEALEKVETNTRNILELEEPVRSAVSALKEGDCSTNLATLLSALTEFTGYESSICVLYYDKSVMEEVRAAQYVINSYDGVFAELQQLVVQAFINKNQFSDQNSIVETFEMEYQKRANAWDNVKPEVEGFIDGLSSGIGKSNEEMGACMKKIRDDVSAAYTRMFGRVQMCIEIENTPELFSSSFAPILLEDVLPRILRHFEIVQ